MSRKKKRKSINFQVPFWTVSTSMWCFSKTYSNNGRDQALFIWTRIQSAIHGMKTPDLIESPIHWRLLICLALNVLSTCHIAPIAPQYNVAVFVVPNVVFTWETIHWYCRNSPWTNNLQLLHMATRGTATFTTYGWIVTISAWTAGEYFENIVPWRYILAFLCQSAPLLWKGIM